MTNALSSFKESISSKDIIFLSAEGVDLTFETKIIKINDDNLVIQNTIPFTYIEKVVSKNKFTLQCHKNRIESSELKNNGVDIIFPLDSNRVMAETRDEERVDVRENSKITLRMLNPFDQKTYLEKPVLDMSESGFSVRIKTQSKVFMSGIVFTSLEVMDSGRCIKKCQGQVVYSRHYIDLKGREYCQVGFRIK